jgi:hypothetical protein
MWHDGPCSEVGQLMLKLVVFEHFCGCFGRTRAVGDQKDSAQATISRCQLAILGQVVGLGCLPWSCRLCLGGRSWCSVHQTWPHRSQCEIFYIHRSW